MGNFAQYAVSITLFIAIPVAVQWLVSKLTARRALSELQQNSGQAVPQAIRD